MKKLFLLSAVALTSAMTCQVTAAPTLQAQNVALRPHLQSLTQGKLVDCQELPNGYAIETRELPDGHLIKNTKRPMALKPGTARMQAHKTPTRHIKAVALTDAQTADEAPSFYEDFEGWDGTTSCWLPDGWSQINSSEEIKTLKDGAFTWHTVNPANYQLIPGSLDGQYYAMIFHASYKDENGTKVELPQDEWLITPAFTPKHNEVMSFYLAYAPLFLFNCTNDNLDFSDPNNITFKEKIPATTLKIKVREVGGEWVQLYDIFEEWKDWYDFQELLEYYSTSEFLNYELDIAKYAGKNIQLAFQFVGQYGNAMEIDALETVQVEIESNYIRPEGALYWGLSADYKSYDTDGDMPLLLPAYGNVTWANRSSSSSFFYKWTYANPENPDETLTSDEDDLMISYPADCNVANNIFDAPALTAYASTNIYDTYTLPVPFLQAGGKAVYTDPTNTTAEFGTGNYELKYGYGTLTTGDNMPICSFNPMADAFWLNVCNTPYYKKICLSGIGNRFENPAHPFVFSKMWVFGTGNMDEDATITMKITKMDASGSPTTTIATATCSGADIISTTIGNDTYQCLPFQFKDKDGNPTDIIVDCATYAILTGLTQGYSFAPYMTIQPHERKENNGILFLDYYYNSSDTKPVYANYKWTVTEMLNITGLSSTDYYGSFLYSFDAVYPWMECDDSTFEASMAGASKTFNLNSYYSSDKWTVTISDNASSWLSYTTNGRSLTLTAAPADGSERSCTVTVSAPACTKTFTVSQNKNAAIDAIASDSGDIKVSINGGNIVIENNGNATGGKLFNITGQLTKAFSLTDGLNTIDAANIASGAYIIILDNGTTAKVIK